uniref:CCHC-type domain-containing protein n=1 Tax=Sinocyclocheilus grahami TaxID=75366 RepID=A0A672NX11_SINGR
MNSADFTRGGTKSFLSSHKQLMSFVWKDSILRKWIKVEDTATWLSMHCTVLNTSLMRDEDGIKTGASKFQVHLKKDAEGNYHHLPSVIQLGPIRGYVFYNGQPKECRKCGSLDHIAANCELEICRHCKSKEHGSKDCQLPKKCNLCGAKIVASFKNYTNMRSSIT